MHLKPMCIQKIAALLMLALLCSCGLSKPPLQRTLTTDVKRIELAALDVNHIILIRRLNPLFAVMGSSGMVLDAAVVANHAYSYEKRAGAVSEQSLDLFIRTLTDELARRGYHVGQSQLDYWQYYRKKKQGLLAKTDAILRIGIKQMGFWSKGLTKPFRPSIFVQAELIEPGSRAVLYSDRFAMGLDKGSLQVMSLGFGETRMLPDPDPDARFPKFSDLLEHAPQSREALLKIVSLSAREIAKGFSAPVDSASDLFEPQLFGDLPAVPGSKNLE